MEREEILEALWSDAIFGDENWINGALAGKPGEPFYSSTEVLQRLVDSGCSKSDLAAVLEFATYEAVFTTLTTLEDQDAISEIAAGLHEDLLVARPGR